MKAWKSWFSRIRVDWHMESEVTSPALSKFQNVAAPLSHFNSPLCECTGVLSDRAIETQDKVNSWGGLSIWTERLYRKKTNRTKLVKKRVRCEIKSYKQKERKMKHHEKSKLLVLVIKDHCLVRHKKDKNKMFHYKLVLLRWRTHFSPSSS